MTAKRITLKRNREWVLNVVGLMTVTDDTMERSETDSVVCVRDYMVLADVEENWNQPNN